VKSFDLVRPATLDEALKALGDSGGSSLALAGGQDLLTELAEYLVEADQLVSTIAASGARGRARCAASRPTCSPGPSATARR
jgi:CO/xanthine dehydrogenase FAD-binding subunit